MKQWAIKILFLVLILCDFQPSFCQELALLNLNALHKNLSRTVYDVMQDSKGYIWVSTSDGAFRFDGYSFTAFTTEQGLSDNEILHIKEDSRGRIWFLSFEGSPSVLENGVIRSRKNSSLFRNLLIHGYCGDMLEDESGILWFINSLSITRLDSGEESCVFVPPHVDPNEVILGAFLYGGKVLIVTQDEIIEAESEKIMYRFPVSIRTASGHCRPLVNFGSSVFLTNANQLVKISTQTFPFTSLVLKKESYPSFQGINKDTEAGIMLFGLNGIYHFDTLSFEVKKISLKKLSVTNTLTDREGNTWFGTQGHGLFLSINPQIMVWDQMGGLQSDNIFNVSGYGTDTLITGYDLFRYDVLVSGKIFPFRDLTIESPLGRTYKIHPDKKGGFLLADDLVGIHFQNILSQTTFQLSNKDFVIDPSGKYWAASARGAFSLKTKGNRDASGLWEWVPDLMLVFDRTNSLLFLDGDSIFSGGSYGLKLFVKGKEIPIFSEGIDFSERVVDIEESRSGWIWYCTASDGVVGFNADTALHFSLQTGLASDLCRNLFIDEKDNIWVATARGLSRISMANMNDKCQASVRNYTLEDGLISEEINDVYVSHDTVFAATPSGLLVFPSHTKILFHQNPILNLEFFKVNGIEKSFVKEISIPHNENFVEIEYSGLSFQSLGRIVYRYRLFGKEDKWRETRQTSLTFSLLPPGQYTLEIQALNKGGLASEIKTVIFVIHPPFWKSTWFIILFSALVIGIVIFILRLRSENVKKEHLLEKRKLEADNEKSLFEKQLIELEQKALLLQMNPHFIFNAINSIQGFYAEGDILSARNYISILSGLLRKILEFSGQFFIPLVEEVNLLEMYLQLNSLRFENKFEYSISCQDIDNQSNIGIPPMLIQPLLENAILHGIMPSKKAGYISVVIVKQGKMLKCTVQDNGIGREKSSLMQKLSHQNSIGISVTEDRIRLINKELGKVGSFSITDLYGSEGEAEGTKIDFEIACKNLLETE